MSEGRELWHRLGKRGPGDRIRRQSRGVVFDACNIVRYVGSTNILARRYSRFKQVVLLLPSRLYQPYIMGVQSGRASRPIAVAIDLQVERPVSGHLKYLLTVSQCSNSPTLRFHETDGTFEYTPSIEANGIDEDAAFCLCLSLETGDQ
jgi:hypothetical protein